MDKRSGHLTLAKKVVEQFQSMPGVEAIALGGSQTRGSMDEHSDIDLYIYSSEIIPLTKRQALVEKLGARNADMNLTFWDLGDEWFDLETGIEIDVMYWDPVWIEDQLNRVLVLHQANRGYTTCFWHTVLNSEIMFDRHGWFGYLQEKCKQPYPEELKWAILAKNHPVFNLYKSK